MLSDGCKGSDLSAIPATVATATVGAIAIAIAIAILQALVAPCSWMPAPLLVLGAVPIVHFVNGDLLGRIIRSFLVP